MRRRSVLAFAATVALGACALGGCSSTPEAAPTSATEALATAKSTLDAASWITLALSSTDVPTGASGVGAASGTGQISATEPKFQGTVTARVSGVVGNVAVIAIGDKVWFKLFTPDYQVADLASLDAPNPAMFFVPETGLSSLISQTVNPVAGQQTRLGSEVLSTYAGTLPAAAVTTMLKLGAGAPDFAVTYGIADNGELRTVDLRGQFYPGATSTFRLQLTKYGQSVDITAP